MEKQKQSQFLRSHGADWLIIAVLDNWQALVSILINLVAMGIKKFRVGKTQKNILSAQ